MVFEIKKNYVVEEIENVQNLTFLKDGCDLRIRINDLDYTGKRAHLRFFLCRKDTGAALLAVGERLYTESGETVVTNEKLVQQAERKRAKLQQQITEEQANIARLAVLITETDRSQQEINKLKKQKTDAEKRVADWQTELDATPPVTPITEVKNTWDDFLAHFDNGAITPAGDASLRLEMLNSGRTLDFYLSEQRPR